MPECQQSTRVRTLRTSFGSFGLGAPIPAKRFSESMSSMKAVGRVPTGVSNSQRCSTMLQNGNSIVCCFGRWTALVARVWPKRLPISSASSPYGVAFHSYTEPHLATDNELVRNILLALLSSLAKLEAQKVSDRTKAGMARAKANGIKIGRPKLGIEIRQKIVQRAKKGETPYAIAKALGIDRHTAAKYAQSPA
jgi:Resolvase, N terminal domain